MSEQPTELNLKRRARFIVTHVLGHGDLSAEDEANVAGVEGVLAGVALEAGDAVQAACAGPHDDTCGGYGGADCECDCCRPVDAAKVLGILR